MADKRLSDLDPVNVMASSDMFLMQQSAAGEAKRMYGSVIQTFAENKALQRTNQRVDELVRAGIRGYGVEDIETVSEGGAGQYNTYRGIYKNPETHAVVGYTSTFQVKNGTNGLNLPPVHAENITVATSAWSADTTYEDFPYRALVTDAGFANMASTDIPNIVLHPTDASMGIVAPVCATYINGQTKGIYIYANDAPTDPIHILTAYAIHTQN